MIDAETQQSVELRVVHSIRDIPEADWQALVGEEGSPFTEWTWLDCLEEAGCVGSSRGEAATDHASGWYACHLALYRGEQLIAAAPAYLKGNSEGEFVFDWSWADLARRIRVPYYPKLIVAVPFSPVTGERVLVRTGEDREALTSLIARAVRDVSGELGAHSAHVLFPNESEVPYWEASGYARRVGVQYHWHNKGYATWEDFLASFNSKRRHQLKREASQAEKQGISIETLTPDRITPAMVDAMFDFYGVTVDKFSWGRRYLNRAFFELVATRFKRNLAWVVATQDGAPIAGAFNVAKGKRLYGRYWGAKVDLPFLHFNVCYYHGVKHAIARGLEAFEPGAGGEHKRPRGFEPTLTHSAHYLADARMRDIVGEFLVRERAAIEAHVAGGGDDDVTT